MAKKKKSPPTEDETWSAMIHITGNKKAVKKLVDAVQNEKDKGNLETGLTLSGPGGTVKGLIDRAKSQIEDKSKDSSG